MAMVEPDERFTGVERPDPMLRAAEERCLDAEQRCFRAERRRFEAERRREQVEVLLDQAREAGIRMEQIVTELGSLLADLGRAIARTDDSLEEEPATSVTPDRSSEQTVDALSAAITRLRANVQAVEAAPSHVRHSVATSSESSLSQRPPHKHSASWIARRRARRKQRS